MVSLSNITNSDYTNYVVFIQNMDLFVSTSPLFGDSYVLPTALCAAVRPPNALNHAYDFLRLVRNRAVVSLLDVAEMTYTVIFLVIYLIT